MRRVVTGALEIERANKKIGSSLEAAPQVYIKDDELLSALEGIDFAEVCITSGIEVIDGEAPEGAFTLPDVAGRRRGAAGAPRAPSARAPGASPTTWAAIRTSPSCPPAMPRRCGSSTSAHRFDRS